MLSKQTKRKNGTYQSQAPTTQTRTGTDAPPSASSAPSIARSVFQSQAIAPPQPTTIAPDFTNRADLNFSGAESHPYAYPPHISDSNLQLLSMIQQGFAPATDRNTFETTAQTASPTQTAIPRQLIRKRTRNSAQGVIPSLPNSNPPQPLNSSAYRTFASSSFSAVATSEDVYPTHTGASLFSAPHFDHAPHQVSNVASFNPHYAPHFMHPASYSSQQDLSSDAMVLSTERFSGPVPGALDPNGNTLPNISIAQPQQPPSFERVVAAFPGMVVPDLQFKADFTEEDLLLATPLTPSSHPSEISAFPTLSPGLTPPPISPSQADSFSAAEDAETDEELLTDARKKPKRTRKPIARDKARPSEDKYRGDLRGKVEAVSNGLKSLPEDMKPDEFKGKDSSFKPSKGKIFDGCLHTIETVTTLYNELQQTKEELAHLKLQLRVQQQQQHALQYPKNFSVDTKPFQFPSFAQDYSPSMMTQ